MQNEKSVDDILEEIRDLFVEPKELSKELGDKGTQSNSASVVDEIKSIEKISGMVEKIDENYQAAATDLNSSVSKGTFFTKNRTAIFFIGIFIAIAVLF